MQKNAPTSNEPRPTFDPFPDESAASVVNQTNKILSVLPLLCPWNRFHEFSMRGKLNGSVSNREKFDKRIK